MTVTDRHGPALRFGLMYLQAAPFGPLLERVRRGEEMGFDGLWVADHMTGQYPDLVSHEAWSLLGAIAMATSRARIGTLVTPITFRLLYSPVDPGTFTRVPALERALERIAAESIPARRAASSRLA